MRVKREGSGRCKGQERSKKLLQWEQGPREMRAGEANDQGLREGEVRGESEGSEIREQEEQGLRGSRAKGT